jgi:hypothetical protein
VLFFFLNAKAKIENLAIDQAVYLLMNGDFSDVELEDSDEEISGNWNR